MIQSSVYDDRVVNPLVTGEDGIAVLITEVLRPFPDEGSIDPNWVKMLNAIRVQEKLIRNRYEIKKKTFEISIRSTEFNEDMLGRKVSNIDEFFDVIDW